MKWSRKTPDAYKVNISVGRIVERLEKHIQGEIEMQASAVTAALGLLKKKMPDLAATTLSGDADNPLKLTVQAIQQTIVRAQPKQIEHDASHALPSAALPDKDASNIK